MSGTVASQITSVHSKAFNAASLLTDGFDIEASYQFDLQDYDIPGNFTLRSLVNHISKFISDTGIPAPRETRNWPVRSAAAATARPTTSRAATR